MQSNNLKIQSTAKITTRTSSPDEPTIYVCDLETTVDPLTEYFEEDGTPYYVQEQTKTEIWLGAMVELRTTNVDFIYSGEEVMEWIEARPRESLLYFHNLKFDGSFLMHLLDERGYTQGTVDVQPRDSYFSPEGDYTIEYKADQAFVKTKNLLPGQYKYLISSKGVWYAISLVTPGGVAVSIWDSAKLLPMSVKALGGKKGFNTKAKKQVFHDDDYTHSITDPVLYSDMNYVADDVLVVKECLEIMFDQGNTGMTIGSNCMRTFKEMKGEKQFKKAFPDLSKKTMSNGMSAYDYCLNSYFGGWCYVNRYMKRKVYKKGFVIDVNSLYPSMMHSESGNYYPVGEGKSNCGSPTNKDIKDYFIFRRFKCRFKLKQGYLPFIHIRGDMMYPANENLESSDVDFNQVLKSFGLQAGSPGKHMVETYTIGGKKYTTQREYTMTQNEFELFQEHYELFDYEAIDYVSFKKELGVFDAYINHFRKMKIDADINGNAALRTIAKLFLNNLYGKLATKKDSSYKTVEVKDGVLKFKTVHSEEMDTVHMAAGSAVTSYARCFTIRAAQKNYFEGKDKGFAYADTDSLHFVNYDLHEVVGCPIDDTAFNHWSYDCQSFNTATYTRQKTYIEVVDIDGKGNVLAEPELNIVGCGMTPKVKKNLAEMLKTGKITYNDIKPGLTIPGSLKAKQIKGGILLVDSDFVLRA